MQKVIILYTKNTVTMKNFMDENFLLQTETAQKLYHEHIRLLQENYLPENRVYRYNFFYDNCATRPRDKIEVR